MQVSPPYNVAVAHIIIKRLFTFISNCTFFACLPKFWRKMRDLIFNVYSTSWSNGTGKGAETSIQSVYNPITHSGYGVNRGQGPLYWVCTGLHGSRAHDCNKALLMIVGYRQNTFFLLFKMHQKTHSSKGP
jgi:hypothetical protein